MPSYVDGQPEGAAGVASAGPHTHTGYASALHGHAEYLTTAHAAGVDPHPVYALDGDVAADLGAHLLSDVHTQPQPAAAHGHIGTAAAAHGHADTASFVAAHAHAGTAAAAHGHGETANYSLVGHGHTGTGGGGGQAPAAPALVWTLSPPAAGLQWVNQPAALTEFTGGASSALYRAHVDLTNALSARVLAALTATGNAAAPGAYLHAEVSADGAGAAFAPIASASLSATGLRAGGWTGIPVALRAPGVLRLAGTGGNGSADPTFGLIQVQVR